MSRTIEYWQDKCVELEDELYRLRETTVRREDVVPLGEALEHISKWAPCYCLIEEETGVRDGKACPTCEAEEALNEAREKGLIP